MCPVRPSIRTWVKSHRRCLYLDFFFPSLSLKYSFSEGCISLTAPLLCVQYWMSPRPHDGVNWPSWTSISTVSQQMDQIASVQHTSDSHQTQPRATVRQSLLLQEECYTDFTTLLRLSQTYNWVKRRNTWYGWTKKTICIRLPKQSAFLQIFQLVTNSTPPLDCQILSLAPKSPYTAQGKETNICLRVTQQSQVLFPSCISL